MSAQSVPEIPLGTVTTQPGGSAVQYTQFPSNATVTIPPRAVLVVSLNNVVIARCNNYTSERIHHACMHLQFFLQPTLATNPPKYEYVPNDFMVFSALTLSFCCLFSPLIALMCGLPALLYSRQVW